MFTFEVKITLGNYAMQDTSDLADALDRLAVRLRAQSVEQVRGRGLCNVRDAVGDRVGYYRLSRADNAIWSNA